MDLFALDFMQRAMVAALFTGLAAPAVGTYLVQRRLALMGDGIGHVAVTGVALGLLTGTSPTWTAVVVAVLGAVLIEVIRERGHTNGDVALALLFYGGLAGGVLLTGLGGQSTNRLQELPLRLDHHDLRERRAGHHGARRRRGRGGGRAVPQLFAVAQDQEFARVAGLDVRAYNLLVAVLAAVSVTVAMRTVGLLLVSRADGGAGGDLAAADPLVPHHAGRRDGTGHAGLGRRPGRLRVRVVPAGGRLTRR